MKNIYTVLNHYLDDLYQVSYQVSSQEDLFYPCYHFKCESQATASIITDIALHALHYSIIAKGQLQCYYFKYENNEVIIYSHSPADWGRKINPNFLSKIREDTNTFMHYFSVNWNPLDHTRLKKINCDLNPDYIIYEKLLNDQSEEMYHTTLNSCIKILNQYIGDSNSLHVGQILNEGLYIAGKEEEVLKLLRLIKREMLPLQPKTLLQTCIDVVKKNQISFQGIIPLDLIEKIEKH